MQWIRRAWNLPLVAHAGALLLVLVGFVMITGPAVPFTTDEGAAVIQGRLLEQNGSWLLPASTVDPAGIAQTFPHGDHGQRGTAAYGKHPAYPLLIALADRVGGMTGVRMLSAIGTWLAAIGATFLGRRVRKGTERSCLWLVGLGSPLLVDSGLVLAHTLAAATAVFAVLAVLDVMAGRHPAGAWIGGVLLTAATVALRSEGIFLVPALALGVCGLARSRRAVLLAASLVMSGGSVLIAERLFLRRTVGPALASAAGQSGSVVAGRLHGLGRTWFQVSYSGGLGALVLFVAVIAFTGAALLLRTGRRPALAAPFVLCGAVAYAVRPLIGHPATIPGLVVAFPAGWVALLLVRRADVAGDAARLAAVTAGLIVGAVIATQYAIGGGVEWGGRYFAIVLPLVAPMIVVTLRRFDSRLLNGALAASMMALGVFGVSTLRHTRSATSVVVAGVRSAANDLDGPPVVLSTSRLLPQLDWRGFDTIRWVTPMPDDLSAAGRQLAAADIRQVVLVADDPQAQLIDLPDYQLAAHQPQPNRIIPIVVLERRT